MAHIAWNYAGEDYREEPGYIQGIQAVEKSILPVKEEFVVDDIEKLIERLIKHKRGHYQNDQRVIFSCEYQEDSVKVLYVGVGQAAGGAVGEGAAGMRGKPDVGRPGYRTTGSSAA